MKKTNLLLPILIISLTILSAFADLGDTEGCDSFTDRLNIDQLIPLNVVSKDTNHTQTIDTLVQDRLSKAIEIFNKNKGNLENLKAQCDAVKKEINHPSRQTTQLEINFAKEVFKQMTTNSGVLAFIDNNLNTTTALHSDITDTKKISIKQYKIQDKNTVSVIQPKFTFRIQRSPDEKIYYTICSDKLTSFFRNGIKLLTQKNDAIDKNGQPINPQRLASEKAKHSILNNTEDKSIFYSKAAAKFSGYMFYRDLLHPTNGLVSCNEKGLQLNTNKSFHLSEYANSLWDESLNCTEFNPDIANKMASNISKALKSSTGIPDLKCPLKKVEDTSRALALDCQMSFGNKTSPANLDRICSMLINPKLGNITSKNQEQINATLKEGTAK